MSLSTDTIGVVVVTFRRQVQLQRTLKAILGQGILGHHIWVINNDKNDNLDYLKNEIGLDLLNIIVSEENIASAGGFALGMKCVLEKGLDWVWLFNDDSRPIEGSLESILRYKEILEKPRAGMVKLANLNAKGEAILQFWKGRRFPKYVPVSNDLIKTDLITFDGCLISSNLIREIGTCDPKYFMGTYEFDYCLRAKDHEFEIFTLPNGLIEDEKAGSIGGTPPWRQYYNTRNHLWLGLNRRSAKTVLAWLVRELKFTYAILRWEDKKGERLKIKVLATWHALRGKRGKTLDPILFSNGTKNLN
ncbi:GT2 family glycosyltransferase [Algoriphagus boseongensis]|uniref:GT2 family glycosyltransferase n=1 Tax=Algoriphagus boseongensis TaxID=1442587 RepID=A0A4R6TBY2_9BACT|nr:glycosyltransferase [Algoriphagus boseongensis]TDQ19572.1 GT2 family glycosyltransferase [Algoriphagus boseongensis]